MIRRTQTMMITAAVLASHAGATITLTDGSAKFTMRNGTFTGGAWAADLFTEIGGQDHMFRNQWYYRTESQIMEHQLSSDNNSDEGAAGNTGFILWTESGFDFRLDITLTDTGQDSARVVQVMTATNQTGFPNLLTLFNYTDFEFGGFLSPNFAQRDLNGIQIANPNLPDQAARFDDTSNANHWQIADGLEILDQLNDPNVTVLTDSNTQSFDDTTGAYQFAIQTSHGQSITITTTLLVNPAQNHADLNNDDALNFLDVSLFLNLFAQSDPQADFNNDGNFNFLDVSAFLDAFALGL